MIIIFICQYLSSSSRKVVLFSLASSLFVADFIFLRKYITYITQASLGLVVLLPQLPEFLDCGVYHYSQEKGKFLRNVTTTLTSQQDK